MNLYLQTNIIFLYSISCMRMHLIHQGLWLEIFIGFYNFRKVGNLPISQANLTKYSPHAFLHVSLLSLLGQMSKWPCFIFFLFIFWVQKHQLNSLHANILPSHKKTFLSTIRSQNQIHTYTHTHLCWALIVNDTESQQKSYCHGYHHKANKFRSMLNEQDVLVSIMV